MRAYKPEGTVGFVPTMGALHSGHITLIEKALSECDTVVASVFVNPMQFNQVEDFDKYPRVAEIDAKMLYEAGCHALFLPSAAEMYPTGKAELGMTFGKVEQVLEGAFRPGHFSGVGVVVAKLFNLVQPDKAYFGQKDLQQLAIIRQMVKDLDMPVDVVAVPTVREASGLAKSSRNQRLSPEGLSEAAHLYEALHAGAGILHVNPHAAAQTAREVLSLRPGWKVEYIEAVNPDTFEVLSGRDLPHHGPAALAVAAWLEGVRLIDNIVIV